MKKWYEIPGWFDFQDIYSRVIDEFHHSGGVFVEVGSWLGRSSAYFAEHVYRSADFFTKQYYGDSFPLLKLHCVDTWEGSEEHKLYVAQHDVYAEFCENVGGWIERGLIVPVRKPSVEAARDYGDGSLVGVFIDASHEYEDVLADIRAWWPKVMQGGYFGGHDINWPGVARAVQESFPGVQPLGSSWLVRKSE
ncbi:MAG: class I SAM-dependent methyltransferase [Dehalococcoidia bacterium]